MSATPVATPEADTEAAEAAVEAITGAAGQDATFSLQLSQDQKDIREWVHGFAADVMRPAAHEWDEKEQTPWPIIQEAAKIGLYGFEGIAAVLRRPHRPRPADRQRGAVLGRRRDRHVDHGHLARRRRDLRAGLGRADRRVDPALLRHARRHQGRGVLRLGAERRLRRLRRAHHARSSTRPPASGCSTARRRGPRTAGSPTSTS